jgi:hypothetical protein
MIACECSCRDRERAIERVSARIGADGVALPRLGGACYDRSAFGRA